MIISVLSRQLDIFFLTPTLATPNTVVYAGEEDFRTAPTVVFALIVAI